MLYKKINLFHMEMYNSELKQFFNKNDDVIKILKIN